MFKQELTLKSCATPLAEKFMSFEYIEQLLKVETKWVRFVTVYRPPPSATNGFTVQQFLSEFTTFLERLTVLPGGALIVRDFNFHGEDPSDTSAIAFLDQLNAFNLVQHVSQSTHISGHTLDLVITGKDNNVLTESILVHPAWISDHKLLQFHLVAPKPSTQPKAVTVRNWKAVDTNDLLEDLKNQNIDL